MPFWIRMIVVVGEMRGRTSSGVGGVVGRALLVRMR